MFLKTFHQGRSAMDSDVYKRQQQHAPEHMLVARQRNFLLELVDGGGFMEQDVYKRQHRDRFRTQFVKFFHGVLGHIAEMCIRDRYIANLSSNFY